MQKAMWIYLQNGHRALLVQYPKLDKDTTNSAEEDVESKSEEKIKKSMEGLGKTTFQQLVGRKCSDVEIIASSKIPV